MQDLTTRMAAARRIRRPLRHTRPLRAQLALAAGLAVAFIAYTWLVVNWGPFVRLDDALNRDWHVQSLWPVLSKVDRIGQGSPTNLSPERAFCLPLLVIVAAVLSVRHRSIRPLGLAAAAVLAENILVLVAKLAMARGRPLSGQTFFVGGDLYPSGHTANMLVFYGLCYYLVVHYGEVSERTRRVLFAVLVALSAVMFATSLLMRWHWFSDLIGGFLIGGLVLALTAGIDAAVPFRSHRQVRVPARQVVHSVVVPSRGEQSADDDVIGLPPHPIGIRTGVTQVWLDASMTSRRALSRASASAERRSTRS